MKKVKTSDIFEKAVGHLIKPLPLVHKNQYNGCCSAIDRAFDEFYPLDYSREVDETYDRVHDIFFEMYGPDRLDRIWWFGYPGAENLQDRILALTFAAEYMRLCGD